MDPENTAQLNGEIIQPVSDFFEAMSFFFLMKWKSEQIDFFHSFLFIPVKKKKTTVRMKK